MYCNGNFMPQEIPPRNAATPSNVTVKILDSSMHSFINLSQHLFGSYRLRSSSAPGSVLGLGLF